MRNVEIVDHMQYDDKDQDIDESHEVRLLLSAGDAQVDQGSEAKRDEVDSDA